MRKKYMAPLMEVVALTDIDIMTASLGEDETPFVPTSLDDVESINE